MCWQAPHKDANCSARITPNSAVIFGPALPTAVGSAAALQSAPLYNASFGGTPGAAASTHTFRTVVEGAAVPIFGNAADVPWNVTWPNGDQPTILWDTGAYGEQ